MLQYILICRSCGKYMSEEMIWEEPDTIKKIYLYNVDKGLVPQKKLKKQFCSECFNKED